ncbi:MAG: guanylate kinase [Gammaproteobacteria bacterium]|nr:guanylate kinase [Gammaproteobacteria bacterium]
MSKGNLIIITAASATGKTSLVRKLLKRVSNLQVSISYTTRVPRPQDQEGVDYHFVDTTEFERRATDGDFLEHAVIYDYQYGTSRAWVEAKLAAGIDVILEIDCQGARQIQAQFPKAVSIFILPPSMQVLKERIQKRGQDSPEVIAKRMAAAYEEVKHYNEFKYLVLNADFDQALEELTHIILAERLQCRIQQEILSDLLINLTTSN